MLKINLRGRFEVQIANGNVSPAYVFGMQRTHHKFRGYILISYWILVKRICRNPISQWDIIFLTDLIFTE